MIRDDFDSPILDVAWTAVNFEASGPSYSLTNNPGNFQLSVPDGRPFDQWIGVDDLPEIFRTDMGEGNFAIETKLNMESFVEGAPFTVGLTVRFGSGDLLMWGPTVGAFQLEAVRSGDPQLVVFRGWNKPEVFLRIEKSGHVYSFFHKADENDRWVADGQYRPANATVQAVGLAAKTWTDTGAHLVTSFDYFSCIVGANVSDIGEETGDAQSFGNICTRFVPAHGPLLSIPPNIPGQGTRFKNTRILLPDTIAFDRTTVIDTAPQLYRLDLDSTEWTLETVVTMIYSDPAIASAGLFLQFSQTDAIIFGLTDGDRLTLHRTISGDIFSIGGFSDRLWLRITRLGNLYSFAFKQTLEAQWTNTLSLPLPAVIEKGGVTARTTSPANAAFDFGYLHLVKPTPVQNSITAPIPLPKAMPCVALPRSSTSDDLVTANASLILENDLLRLEVDSEDGTILGITNKAVGLELINHDGIKRSVWRIETTPGSQESAWMTPETAGAVFTGTQCPDQIDMEWVCTNGITVHAVASFDSTTCDLVFGVEVSNTGTLQVVTLEYPRIDRVASLSNDDHLMHPFATGFLFKNPVALFPSGGGIPVSPYPEGFNGAPAQIMAYYSHNTGGFGFWIDDPTGWVKWLDCFKAAGEDLLTVRFMHSASGIQPGNGLSLLYTVRVFALGDGNWYEAAEHYRDWAKDQAFCELGPLHAREDKATWLLEEVGLTTFGVSTQYDRQPWLEYFHEISEQPVFHITGPNWQKSRWDYLGNQNGGTDGVFPHAVIDSYLDTLRRQGDYFAAFSFGTLFSDSTSIDYADAQAAFQQIPGRVAIGLTNTLSRDAYDFPFLCPVAGALTRFSVFRDAGAVEQLDANAIYYDIGPNNVMLRCLSPNHGHPVGGGNALTEGYKHMMFAVRQATQAAGGRYTPLGCEMANEAFIPYMDFSQSRAEASPSSSFEAWSFYEWIRQGQCEKIPLFAFLYHEYGPVRLDGWGRLDHEQGELFYWIAARVYAWGGIYEVNCEFSSLDVVRGNKDDITQSFSPFARDRYYEVDTEKADFLAQMAMARTGYANKYLAYGEMIRPLAIDVPEVNMDWFHFNSPPDSMEYQEFGTHTVPTVIQSAWRYMQESCGFFFVNISVQPITITVDVDPDALDIIHSSPLHALHVTVQGSTDLGELVGVTTLTLSIPARSAALLEIRS